MKRLLILALVCLGVSFLAPTASASCYGYVITYYGHYAIDGSTFCYWGGGPPITPDIVGQKEVDCNNQVTTWGNTSCEMYEPTINYFECECLAQNNLEDAPGAAECAAERAAD
jgi:hypothetical protein